MTVHADADWDALALGERRALVRAVVERVTVLPNATRRAADQSERLLVAFRD